MNRDADPFGIVRLTAEDVIRLFMRHNPRMRAPVSLYHRHRFPAEIISHCLWLYFRFAVSFRDVEITLPSGETSVQSEQLPSSDEIEIRRMGRGDLRRRGR